MSKINNSGLRRALADARARGSREGTRDTAEIARDPVGPIDGNRRHPLVRTRSRAPDSQDSPETTRLRAFQRALAEMNERFTEET